MNPLGHFRGILAVTFVTAATALSAQVARTNPAITPPPLPVIEYKSVAPGVTLHQASPVLYFRGILGMTPAQRERALADKSPAAKKVLLEKVAEYQQLPAEIREARLRQTQLRWEINSLEKLTPAAAAAYIKDAPLEDRPLLEDYIRWQSLPPAARKDFLAQLSPDRHQVLTQALAQWESVPESDRQQVTGQFSQIIYLSRDQQKQTLNAFSDAERTTMETALSRFATLPPAERKACVQSFAEFATMDPAERDEFLKNAARWEAMTTSQRDLWRTLVQKYPLTPPSPPGLFNVVRYPPLPPGMIPTPPSPPGLKASLTPVNAAR